MLCILAGCSVLLRLHVSRKRVLRECLILFKVFVADMLCFPSLPIDVLSLGYTMDELDEQWLPMVKSWRLNEVRSTMDSDSLKGYNKCITLHSSYQY